MLSTFTCYKDLESYFYFMKRSIVISWLLLADDSLYIKCELTTQTLLDQLKRAQSMDEAGPIVDKLWKNGLALIRIVMKRL